MYRIALIYIYIWFSRLSTAQRQKNKKVFGFNTLKTAIEIKSNKKICLLHQKIKERTVIKILQLCRLGYSINIFMLINFSQYCAKHTVLI